MNEIWNGKESCIGCVPKDGSLFSMVANPINLASQNVERANVAANVAAAASAVQDAGRSV